MYLPAVPNASRREVKAGTQRSRSQIQSSESEASGSSLSGSMPSAGLAIRPGDTSPASHSSSSNSPLVTETDSPKPRRLSRASTSTTVSRRRSSDVNKDKAASSQDILAAAQGQNSNEDAEIRQQLKDLQAKTVTRNRSESLSRLRDSASSLITPAISTSLQHGGSGSGSGTGSTVVSLGSSPAASDRKSNLLRLPESMSGASSPSGNGSSDPSPSTSPGGSPRPGQKVPRAVQKAYDLLEGNGDVLLFFHPPALL